MAHFTLYRNTEARDQLDIFFVSAVSSLLLLRFYLYIAGYPQVGKGSLHIAHMLWGGLLMLVAIILNLAFIGRRLNKLTALIGGIGFGVFIDEIGKFITKDNNYFFRPTIGIIYAIFVMLYLSISFLSRNQKLSSREYQMNALAAMEEAVAHDMDRYEKANVSLLLAHADQHSLVTQHLQELVSKIRPVPAEKPSGLSRASRQIDAWYQQFWAKRRTHGLVQAVALIGLTFFVFGIILTVYANIDSILDIIRGTTTYSQILLAGQILSALLAASFTFMGIIRLQASHIAAFEQFRRAALVNIFLTEFFLFIRWQFGAMPSFLANLAFLLVITFVLHQERRVATQVVKP